MRKILLNEIPKDARLLSIGNFFRADRQSESWRVGAFFAEANGGVEDHHFSIEMSCILGVGRKFVQEEGAPYISGGYTQRLVLPVVEEWRDRPLGECRRLPRQLAKIPEVASQRCFVFHVGDLEVWLPKFELARKLFFHGGFLARAAFEPNGLDMLFSVQVEENAVHIYTPSRTGAPSRLLQIKGYRDHLSWLLLNSDVRQSFESIWQCQNQEQIRSQSGYTRWRFNFVPPTSLSGIHLEVRGAFDQDAKEILAWEIIGLRGLRFGTNVEINFHHPALKQAVRGAGGGQVSGPLPAYSEIKVDVEEEPDEAKERQLIDLPVEGLFFDREPITRVSYNGHKPSAYGQRTDNGEVPGSSTSQTLGIGDDVTGGTIAPGEFQQLDGRQERQDEYPNRFVMLKEIIQQIANIPGIRLLHMDIKPLPHVSRCSYHLMEDKQPRCYLLARFSLDGGLERYLLEIDTTDKKKSLSSRVISLKSGQDAKLAVDSILRGLVKNSLRWPPGMMKNRCDIICAVRHPAGGDSENFEIRMKSWVFRIKESLSGIALLD